MNHEAEDRLKAMGAFIRAQREMANLSLRQLSETARVSNPYLSQLERGLHEPSARVLQAIANALHVSAETLIGHAGGVDADADTNANADESRVHATELAIRSDPVLSDDQKQALLVVYQSYVQANEPRPT